MAEEKKDEQPVKETNPFSKRMQPKKEGEA
jgi:hypothetical protein